MTRSAVPSRASEADSVASALGAHLDLVRMEAGTLDGGDVLRVGQELWVGRSARTDRTGAELLRDFAAADGLTVRAIDVRGLHLKCVCSAPAEDLVVIAEGYGLEAHVPKATRVVRIPESEAYAANTVGVGGRVLVAEGYPAAAERLEAAGLRVRVVSNGEFAKRDGSLTCLSVLY